MVSLSSLQKSRLADQPVLPAIFSSLGELVAEDGGKALPLSASLKKKFPHLETLPSLDFVDKGEKEHRSLNVGVVLSGGQAAGGHNVIVGLFDALKKLHPKSQLIGFRNGPKGLIDDDGEVLTDALLADYRNQGGFDLIGSGRTKIETEKQFAATLATAKKRKLDGIVIIGGDDSNTNAALLAEYFLQHGGSTAVVGVPKTIDGDLKNDAIEVSFGFDTACKTYSETIGSIARDALSAGKYYFFVRLMGRSASHIALECALQTHPNFTLIGEEVLVKKQTVQDITKSLCAMIEKRAKKGKYFGVVLLPEGIVEFIPEVRLLILELNLLLAKGSPDAEAIDALPLMEERIAYVATKLKKSSHACFTQFPKAFQEQLLLERDPHGNVQVAKIETERLFAALVQEEFTRKKDRGEYAVKTSIQPIYLGYEGRSCLPSLFDANYCYALGHVASLLIDQKKTGYMSCVKNLCRPIDEWIPAGIPLVQMMDIEVREGKEKPVITKALVDLEGKPFLAFAEKREAWQIDDDYQNPGPIQFFGPTSVTHSTTQTLVLEKL